MTRSPFGLNVAATESPAQERQSFPWAVVLATALFIIVGGTQMDALQHELIMLKYQAEVPASSSREPATSDGAATAQAQATVSQALTFPWDKLLNTFYQPLMPVRLLAIDASDDGSPTTVRVACAHPDEFWRWLATLKKNPRVATVAATGGSATDAGYTFEVAVTWSGQ